MERREQGLYTYKYHSCGIIIEDRNKKKKFDFSVSALLVATSKTQPFNP